MAAFGLPHGSTHGRVFGDIPTCVPNAILRDRLGVGQISDPQLVFLDLGLVRLFQFVPLAPPQYDLPSAR